MGNKAYEGFVDGLVVVFLIGSLLFLLECRYPYFFLDDDNRGYFLPIFVHNYRSVLSGELPFYNFHQFMGLDNIGMLQSAVFYPPVYLSVLISSLLFGDYFAAIDILVVFHILFGSVGAFSLLRLYLGRESSLFGVFTMALSSFVVYMSDSWWYVSAVFAFFSWILYFDVRFYREKKDWFLILSALMKVGLFYVGYPQYFLFTIVFEVLSIAAMAVYDRIGFVTAFFHLKKISASYFFVLLLCLPLVCASYSTLTEVPERSQKMHMNMYIHMSYPLDILLPSMLFLDVGAYQDIYINKLSFVSFIGYVPLLFLVYFLWAVIFGHIKKKDGNVFVFAVLAFAGLLFSSGIIPVLLYVMPLFNRFRWPFKYHIFFLFFLGILTAFCFEVFFRGKHWKNIMLIKWGVIAVHIVLLASVYLVSPHYNLRQYLNEPDGPGVYDVSELAESQALLDLINEGRVFTLEHPDGYSSRYFGLNYATLHGLFHFAGWEPLVNERTRELTLGLNQLSVYKSSDGTVPLKYLREYGVRWIVSGVNESRRYEGFLLENGLKKVWVDDVRVVYEDPYAFNMVYLEGDEQGDVEYLVEANTIHASFESEKTDYLVFNWVYGDFFEAEVDGKPVKVGKDSLDRMRVEVPAGVNEVVLRYRNRDFELGVWVAVLGVVASVILFLGSRRS